MAEHPAFERSTTSVRRLRLDPLHLGCPSARRCLLSLAQRNGAAMGEFKVTLLQGCQDAFLQLVRCEPLAKAQPSGLYVRSDRAEF